MKQGRILENLDAELRGQAISLAPYGVNEYGFPAKCGRDILSCLLRGEMLVLGGDLWIVEDDGSLRPGYDNWYSNRIPGLSLKEMTTCVMQRADAFFDRNEGSESHIVTFIVD